MKNGAGQVSNIDHRIFSEQIFCHQTCEKEERRVQRVLDRDVRNRKNQDERPVDSGVGKRHDHDSDVVGCMPKLKR